VETQPAFYRSKRGGKKKEKGKKGELRPELAAPTPTTSGRGGKKNRYTLLPQLPPPPPFFGPKRKKKKKPEFRVRHLLTEEKERPRKVRAGFPPPSTYL